jgi:uncharacterized membrane protein YqgA involved in biofilm formation
MNEFKEHLIIFLISIAVGGLIGFVFGEKSMCDRLGGSFSNEYGLCVEKIKELELRRILK